MSLYRIILLVALIISPFLSSKTYAENYQEWEVLIYMQADNDLWSYAQEDLVEIQNGHNEAIKNLMILLDRPGDSGYYLLSLNNDFEDYPTFVLNNVNSKYKIIARFPETAPQVFMYRELLRRSGEQSKLIQIIWGHGEGFTVDGHSQFGGVARDDFPHSKLSISQIREELELSEKEIDILVMDSCLMQTIEVALELSSMVNYEVGSSQIHDFRGLPYGDILKKLDLTKDSYWVAQDFVKVFEKIAASNYDYEQRTMGLTVSSELRSFFIPKLNNLFGLMYNFLKRKPLEKIWMQQEILLLPSFTGEYKDLGQLLSFFENFFMQRNQNLIVSNIQEVRKTLHYVLPTYFYGQYYINEPLYHLGAMKGLSIWFPKSGDEFLKSKNNFENSLFSKQVMNINLFLLELFSKDLF